MTWSLLALLLGLAAVSGMVSWFAQGHLIHLGRRHGFLDHQNERKLDKAPRPRIGGFGVFLGYLVSIYLLVLVNGFFQARLGGIKLKMEPMTVLLYVGAIIFVFILGIWDDFFGLKAVPKLVVELAVASIIYQVGFRIEWLSIPVGSGQADLSWLSYPLTVLWIVGIINAINLIDGLDGLAGGVIALASLTATIILLLEGEFLYACLLAPLLGGVLGFLPFNLYPSRIFMGDGGSLFAGVILSTLIIKASQKASLGISLLVPLGILALPILDTSLAFIRRALKGTSPFKPDAEHIHHRFLRKGYSEKQVVRLLLGVSAFFSLLAVLTYSLPYQFRLGVVVVFFLLILWLLTTLGYIRRPGRRRDSDGANPS